MKKAYTVILILVALLAVSCATSKVEEPATAEEVELTAADFADKTADATIIVLSNATTAGNLKTVAQLQNANFIRQCFNATKWYDSYDLQTIVAENFWFKIANDQICTTGSFSDDAYTESQPWSKKASDSVRVFADKSVVFMKESGDALGYDTYVGEGQSSSYAPWNQIYTSFGMEALFYAPWDYTLAELLTTELTNGQHFQEADYYIIDDVEGNQYKVAAEDVEYCTVKAYRNTINIELADGQVVNDAYSVVPEGVTKDNAQYDEKVIVRGIFAINAKSVYGEEPNTIGNYAGTYYNGVVISDLLEMFDVETPKSAKITVDGTATNYSVSDVLAQRLIHHKSNNFCAIQEHQLKANANDVAKNVQYLTFDNALVVCGVSSSVTVASLNKTANFLTPAYAVVNYINGTSELYEGAIATALQISSVTDVASIQLYY